MKIGFDAKRAFNNRTGLGNYGRFVLNALAQYGYLQELFLYTPKISAELATANAALSGFARLPPSAFQTKLHPLWRSFWVVNQLQKEGIDVFHGLSNELPVGLKKTNIKSVVTIHDLIFERYPELFSRIDRFIYHQKFKTACRQADKIVAVSQQTKRDIVTFYGIEQSRIEVVYQDCDAVFKTRVLVEKLEEVAQKYGLQTPYLLSVGSIETRKNQLRLVQAFREADLPNAQLVLVGKATHYQRQIEDYIQRYQLGGSVKILNQVPFVDLPALYQAATAAVYISLFEGFGIPVVEALHSGVPVLAASGSCLEEAGGGGALYANPLDVSDIANNLKIIWQHHPTRQRLITDGQQHVAQFAAPHVAAQLVRLYESLG